MAKRYYAPADAPPPMHCADAFIGMTTQQFHSWQVNTLMFAYGAVNDRENGTLTACVVEATRLADVGLGLSDDDKVRVGELQEVTRLTLLRAASIVGTAMKTGG
jgi:hypothetical protein